MHLDDKRFAESTDPHARHWTKEVFDHAIENKYNIIFESTMREHGPISEALQRIRGKGTHVTVVGIAANEKLSLTGIFSATKK